MSDAMREKMDNRRAYQVGVTVGKASRQAEIDALLARAEKAESERDAGLLREEDANKRAMLHLRRAEKAEIAAKNYSEFNREWRKRADTTWNDAIEAVCERLADNWTWDDADFLADVQDDLRRILKKGDTP